MLGWAGVDAIEAEELSVVPGLDEIFSLSDIKAYAEAGTWDVIVVDCAPTAETLRLLALPEALGWYVRRIMPVERRVMSRVRPLLSRATTVCAILFMVGAIALGILGKRGPGSVLGGRSPLSQPSTPNTTSPTKAPVPTGAPSVPPK